MPPDQISEHSWVTNLSLYKHWVEFQSKPHFKAHAQFLERTSKLSSHHGPPHTTTGSSGHLNSWPYSGVQKFFNHCHSFVVTFKNFWKYEKYSVVDSSVNLWLDFVNCLRAGLVQKTGPNPLAQFLMLMKLSTCVGGRFCVVVDNGQSTVEEVHDGGIDFRLHQFPVIDVLVNLRLWTITTWFSSVIYIIDVSFNFRCCVGPYLTVRKLWIRYIDIVGFCLMGMHMLGQESVAPIYVQT
jgi:hypothetical protein